MNKYSPEELALAAFPITAFEVALSVQPKPVGGSALKCTIYPVILTGTGHRGIVNFTDYKGEKCYGDARSFYRTEADAAEHIATAYKLQPSPRPDQVPASVAIEPNDVSSDSEQLLDVPTHA